MSRKIFYLGFKNSKSRTCGGARAHQDGAGLQTAPIHAVNNDYSLN